MRSKSRDLMEKIKAFAEQYSVDNLGRTPCTREIGEALGINKATAYRYLVAMRDLGMIEYEDGAIMTSKIRKVNTQQVGMPLAGTIPCGTPEQEEEDIEEYISFPCSVIGRGDFFVLRASGDSMVDAGIDHGDLVIVRKQEEAKTGDIVAALVDGGSTLKRLLYDKHNRPYLHPENREAGYPDIVGTELSIQGVAVYTLKALS